jgi:antitoxin MazE
MKITRLDDGLAVKLPDEIVSALGLKPGDEVDVEIRPRSTRPSLEEREAMIAEMRARARPLPADYKFDREEANRRR